MMLHKQPCLKSSTPQLGTAFHWSLSYHVTLTRFPNSSIHSTFFAQLGVRSLKPKFCCHRWISFSSDLIWKVPVVLDRIISVWEGSWADSKNGVMINPPWVLSHIASSQPQAGKHDEEWRPDEQSSERDEPSMMWDLAVSSPASIYKNPWLCRTSDGYQSLELVELFKIYHFTYLDTTRAELSQTSSNINDENSFPAWSATLSLHQPQSTSATSTYVLKRTSSASSLTSATTVQAWHRKILIIGNVFVHQKVSSSNLRSIYGQIVVVKISNQQQTLSTTPVPMLENP